MKNLMNVFKLLLLLAVLSASSNTNLLAQTLPTIFGINSLSASRSCFSDYNEMYLSWNNSYGAPYKVTISGTGCTTTIILGYNDVSIINGRIHATLFGYHCTGAQVRVVSWFNGKEKGAPASCTVGTCTPVGERNIPLYIEPVDVVLQQPYSTATIIKSVKSYRIASGETLSVKLYQNTNDDFSNSSIPLTIPSYENFWSPNCINFGYPTTTGSGELQMESLLFKGVITGGNVKITATRNNNPLTSQLVYAVVFKGTTPIDAYTIFAKINNEYTGYCYNSNGDHIPTSDDDGSMTSPADGRDIIGKSNNILSANLDIYPSLADQNISLAYNLPEAASIQVAIFNTMGEKMNCVADNMPQEAGNHEQNIDVANLPKGIYFVRFQQGEAVQTRRFVKM